MTLRRIPDDVGAALAAGSGLMTVLDAARAGVGHDRLRTLQHRGLIVALAKGVYADATDYRLERPWDRHVLATRAFLAASPAGTVAADWSAIALLGLPTPDLPPTVPSVIRRRSTTSGSNRTLHGRTRYAALPDRWVVRSRDVESVHPAVAVVDLARSVGAPWSLILADAAAAWSGSVAPLALAAHQLIRWPGMTRSRWAVDNASVDAESPLESAGRCAFLRAGLPPSQSNVWLGIDRPVYRVDHYWPHEKVVAEADGISKYLTNGDPLVAVQLEKDREFVLAQWGLRIVRYGWNRAFGQPEQLARQVGWLLRAPGPSVHPALRWWSNADGRRILGMPVPGFWAS